MLAVYYEDASIRTPGMHFTICYPEACALHISGHFYFPCRISANVGDSLLMVKFAEFTFYALR